MGDGDAGVAFVWQRGARVGALAAWTHHLVVAPGDPLGAPRAQVLLAGTLDGAFYNTAYELGWAGPGRIRMVAAYDSVFKVKGGGATRFTDTIAAPRGLLDLDLATGGLTPVPGGAGVIAYAAAAGGALWIVRSDTLWMLDGAGAATPVREVGPFVSDIAEVDGRILAARRSPFSADDFTVRWWDPATGAAGLVGMPGPVHRLSGGGGRRFIAEVEADGREFGAPADLWLFELPQR